MEQQGQGLRLRGRVVGLHGNRVLVATGRKLYSVWMRNIDSVRVGEEIDWAVFVFWDRKGQLVDLGRIEEEGKEK